MIYVYNKPVRYEEQLAAEVAALGFAGFVQVAGHQTTVEVHYTNQLTGQQEAAVAAAVAAHAAVPGWEPATAVAARHADTIARFQSRAEQVLRAIALAAADGINLIRQQVVGTVTQTWNPAAMANGSGVTSPGVAVPGAVFGDVVDVAAPYDLQGVVATAYVSAANTVKVRLQNGTGAAVDLAVGDWKVYVRRPAAQPQLDPGDVRARVVFYVNSSLAD